MEHSPEINSGGSAASPNCHRGPIVIGMTGGIAAGKSTVAGMLRELGAEVLNADEIAHDVLRAKAVCDELRRAWGDAPFGPDSAPDRRRIADIVFNHPEKLSQLNGWIHPRVREIIRDRLDAARSDDNVRLLVIDAPLLIEGRLDEWCDRILFVDAAPEIRQARAKAERDWPPGEIERREALQKDLNEKRDRADAVIENNGSREETLAQIKCCVERWLCEQTDIPS